MSLDARTLALGASLLLVTSLPASAQTCPVGTSLVTIESADFTSFPPAGWTLTNTTTNCVGGVPNWTNTDPAVRGNLTGGAGAFAIADSDACGSSSVMNATLTTGTLNFTGLTTATVIYNTDYNDLSTGAGTEVAHLDLSLNGGGTWSTLLNWDEDHRGPLQITQALTGADGQANVRVRWDYVNATWDWWWQVDSVLIRACQAGAGCTLTLTCPADQLAAAPPGASSTAVTFPDPVVGGDCTTVTTACSPASGDIFPVGTTTVACTATDVTGAQATCSFDVTVGNETIQEIPTLDAKGFAALTLLLAALSIAWIRRRRA